MIQRITRIYFVFYPLHSPLPARVCASIKKASLFSSIAQAEGACSLCGKFCRRTKRTRIMRALCEGSRWLRGCYTCWGASTGQVLAQAPHSMHSSALMTYLPSPAEMASTGHSLSQAPHSTQASVITYAIGVHLPLIVGAILPSICGFENPQIPNFSGKFLCLAL